MPTTLHNFVAIISYLLLKHRNGYIVRSKNQISQYKRLLLNRSEQERDFLDWISLKVDLTTWSILRTNSIKYQAVKTVRKMGPLKRTFFGQRPTGILAVQLHRYSTAIIWKTLIGWLSNLRYKCVVGFQVPNFFILKLLVFQFGLSKSNLKSNFRICFPIDDLYNDLIC